MKTTRALIIISIVMLSLSQLHAKSIKETFPIGASSEKIPLGYLSLHGNFEKFTWDSNKYNVLGGGFALGLRIHTPMFLEAYIDYINHMSTPTTATTVYKNSVHFGGRTVFLIKSLIVLKAGLGVANIVSAVGSAETGINKFEMNFAGGVSIPINAVFHFDFLFLYRRIFDTPVMNTYGGTAGLLIKFY